MINLSDHSFSARFGWQSHYELYGLFHEQLNHIRWTQVYYEFVLPATNPADFVYFVWSRQNASQQLFGI